MTERRYTEDEAAEIFRVAAELEERAPRALAPAEGLTIAELQAIGREAGLSPELVARAAKRAAEPPARAFRFLGLPIGVSRTVEVDEPLADGDWEELVSELRETFEAKGVVRYDGPFRQWSNGNLHVLVEPTPAGHRLRIRTRNGKPLRFEINVVSGWSDWVRAVQIITQNLKQLGIDASLKTYDFSAFFEALQKGTFDMSMG